MRMKPFEGAMFPVFGRLHVTGWDKYFNFKYRHSMGTLYSFERESDCE